MKTTLVTFIVSFFAFISINAIVPGTHAIEEKEMTKNEQKKLKGGSIYGCTCQCIDGVGVWHSYTSDGSCPGSGFSSQYCGGSGEYVCQ